MRKQVVYTLSLQNVRLSYECANDTDEGTV